MTFLYAESTKKEGVELEKVKKMYNFKKKILQEDDKNYKRISIKLKIEEKVYESKIRYFSSKNKTDKANLTNNICASSNHAHDAEILIKTILDLKELDIRVLPIHDSIGVSLEYVPIVKYLYKKN
jgi:hypothetical protein